MVRLIVVPLDGSPFGERALAPALGIADRTDAALALVSVYEPVVALPPVATSPLLDPLPGVAVLDSSFHEEAKAGRRSYLESIAQQIDRVSHVRVDTALLEGPVTDSLVEYALETRADLFVMASHGRGGMSRLWLGSVTEGIVREATAPVLVVRSGETVHGPDAAPPTPTVFHNVLVALDGSRVAEAVLEVVTQVVGETADLTLVRVVEPIMAMSVAGFGGVAVPGSGGQARGEGDSGEYLESVAGALRARGLSVRTHVMTRRGQTARAILDHARDIRAELIAMTTRGRSGLRRLIVGSVADKVLRGAETAVLLYGPIDE